MDKTETVEMQVPHFDGYECIGFDNPSVGEYVLSIDCSSLEEIKRNGNYPKMICYRKKKPKRYVFEETGEVRKINKGEWYIDDYGDIFNRLHDGCTNDEHRVLKKVEE